MPFDHPTAEAVADALIQYETSGMCHFGKTCGLCDCGRSSLTVEGLAEQDALDLDRARAVLALIPPAIPKYRYPLHILGMGVRPSHRIWVIKDRTSGSWVVGWTTRAGRLNGLNLPTHGKAMKFIDLLIREEML